MKKYTFKVIYFDKHNSVKDAYTRKFTGETLADAIKHLVRINDSYLAYVDFDTYTWKLINVEEVVL